MFLKSLPLRIILVLSPFLQNCSSAPEIKPAEEKEYTVEQLQGSSEPRDELFQIEPVGMETADVPEELQENLNLDEETQKSVAEPEKLVINEDSSSSEEVSSDVPMSVPKAKKVKVAKKESRAIASVSSFKNGFHVFAQDCNMKAKPDNESADAGNINAGKKLWLDHHNSQWFKVYKKSGAVYIPAECIK